MYSSPLSDTIASRAPLGALARRTHTFLLNCERVAPLSMLLPHSLGLLLLACLLFALHLLTLPRWLVALARQLLPAVVVRIPTPAPLVALTIDDAPGVLTKGVLALLAEHRVRATFFVVGEEAVARPREMRSIVDGGHELANHLLRDEPSWRLSPAQFASQVKKVEAILDPYRRGVSKRRWLRPGHGVVRPHMLYTTAALGLSVALGDCYGWDPRNKSARLMAWLLLADARPGSILILHDGAQSRAATLDALRIVLPELQRRGLTACTLSELAASAEPSQGPGGTHTAVLA